MELVPTGGLLPVLPPVGPDVLLLLLALAVSVGPDELAGSIGVQT